jgi:hypothetical protein
MKAYNGSRSVSAIFIDLTTNADERLSSIVCFTPRKGGSGNHWAGPKACLDVSECLVAIIKDSICFWKKIDNVSSEDRERNEEVYVNK